MFAVDTMAPEIIDCPSDRTVTYELVQQGAMVTWTEPHATDNSGYSNLTRQSHQSGDMFIEGVTTVSYVFGDAAGNGAACTFLVTASIGEYDETKLISLLDQSQIVLGAFLAVITLT